MLFFGIYESDVIVIILDWNLFSCPREVGLQSNLMLILVS